MFEFLSVFRIDQIIEGLQGIVTPITSLSWWWGHPSQSCRSGSGHWKSALALTAIALCHHVGTIWLYCFDIWCRDGGKHREHFQLGSGWRAWRIGIAGDNPRRLSHGQER